MNSFKVSVIIPVYNAATYVERAIASVINLPATGEVLLVDDASIDNSLEVCKQLEKKYPNVILLEHADKQNHGASGSRNLGIQHARYPYISFLDADDYYLPNRFDKEQQLFETDPSIDGVYGCTLAIFETEKAKELFYRQYDSPITSVNKILPPEDLFKYLLFGGHGRFHTSAITLKKSLLTKTGLFNESLKFGEDSELWLRCSFLGKLVAGEIYNPISIRWVHEKNSIHQMEEVKSSKYLMNREIFEWAIKTNLPFRVKNSLFIILMQSGENKESQLKLLIKEIRKHPFMLYSSFFIKKLHLIFLSSFNK